MKKDNDYLYQFEYVIENIWRLIHLQDNNPFSDTFGCMDYKFWRDKSVDFADARYQEASATIGILCSKNFDFLRRSKKIPPLSRTYNAFSAGVRYWSKIQNKDGSFDEWYKGERGFAATEFSLIAFGLAYFFLKGRLQKKDEEILRLTSLRAANWLSKRDDFIKSNHQAAAVAALALAYKNFGNKAFASASKKKLASLLKTQTKEGWFPEVGGMDLGYSFVLLDYIALSFLFIKPTAHSLSSMKRLLQFILPHLHPDGTISPEYGICCNDYVSRLGIFLLSKYDRHAKQLMSFFKFSSPGERGISSILADDLRLSRWSYLPILSFLFGANFSTIGKKQVMPQQGHKNLWFVNKKCAVASYHDGNLHIFYSIAGGGVVRIFQDSELIFEDFGIKIDVNRQALHSRSYDCKRKIVYNNHSCFFEGFLSEPSYFSPSFLQRICLRIASFSSIGSRLTRKFIDWMRVKRGSSLNQNSAPFANYNRNFSFKRTISINNKLVVINDEILHDEGVAGACNVETYFNTSFAGKISKVAQHNQGINIDRKINVKEKKVSVEIGK